MTDAVRAKTPFWMGNAWFGGHTSTASDIGWLGRTPKPSRDVTRDFKALNSAAMAGSLTLPPEAKRYVYLFVGGIFSNGFPQALYLHENIDALRSRGCDARRVPIQTKTAVDDNARVIRDYALKVHAETGKRVIFIGHSKGGLDSGAAIARYPEVAAITPAAQGLPPVISLQSPWGGSPIAADLAKDPIQNAVVSFGVKNLLGGDPRCGTDLTHAARQSFLAEHPLPRGTKALCLATTCDSPASTVAATGAYIAANYGVKSDGLVVPSDAFLPGSRSVLLSGLDHMDTVSPSIRRAQYTPASLTLALVALAFQR